MYNAKGKYSENTEEATFVNEGKYEPFAKEGGIELLANLSRPQKSSNQILLFQVMSTNSGSTLVVCVPINFYKYFCKLHIPVNYI